MCIGVLLLFSALHAVISRVHFEGYEPFVWTRLGGLRGVYETFENKTVAAFLGVPFAKPPIGELRFDTPKPANDWWNGYCPPENSSLVRTDCRGSKINKENWDDPNGKGHDQDRYVRAANKTANSCMLTPDHYYPGFNGSEMWNPPDTSNISEDCLYLNIWVPKNSSGDVLVWIFGGGFFSGSPSLDLYNGKVLAALYNITVVNINYRLGPFGFLYLGHNSTVRGNMGLLDQQMALKWISENIKEFGGDPEKVTLFGESAGSASVTAHLLANGSHPYFSKIICLSGSLTNLWSTRTPETMKKVSLKLSKNLSCFDGGNSSAIVACLRGKNATDIQSGSDALFRLELPMTFLFTPINEDNVFFNGNVFDLLKDGNFKKNAPAIFGTVNDEGTFWLPYYLSDSGFAFNSTEPESVQNQALINESQYNDSMKAFMPYFSGSEESKQNLTEEYRQLFSSQKPKGARLRDGVGRFVGDLFFTCNLSDFINTFVENTNTSTYVYYFNMHSSANPWPKWMGVMHGYEIEYVFGRPLSHPELYNKTLLETEQNFSKYIMGMWTQFVKNGTPSQTWAPYNSTKREALILNNSMEAQIYIDLHERQCELIKKAMPMPAQPNITIDSSVDEKS